MNIQLHNYINDILDDYKLTNKVNDNLPRPLIYYYEEADVCLFGRKIVISGFSFRYTTSSYYIAFNASDFSQFYIINPNQLNNLPWHSIIDIIPLNTLNFSLLDLY